MRLTLIHHGWGGLSRQWNTGKNRKKVSPYAGGGITVGGMVKKKEDIITFKADSDLMKVMKEIPNRSEFIRTAILNALENVCPLCNGTGVLTPMQKHHWKEFSAHHGIEQCQHCLERVLVCARTEKGG